MGALRCGHPLSVANLEREGRYFKCVTCRRAQQRRRYHAARAGAVRLAEGLR